MDFDAGEHDGHLDFDIAANDVGRNLVSLRIGNEVDADGEPINAYTYHPVRHKWTFLTNLVLVSQSNTDFTFPSLSTVKYRHTHASSPAW